MRKKLQFKCLIALCGFSLFSSPLLGLVQCPEGATQYDLADTTCSDACVGAETCEEDISGSFNCCFDVAAVPELPSWFGPFFLASLVAGWEYWRTQRRKTASVKLVRRD